MSRDINYQVQADFTSLHDLWKKIIYIITCKSYDLPYIVLSVNAITGLYDTVKDFM